MVWEYSKDLSVRRFLSSTLLFAARSRALGTSRKFSISFLEWTTVNTQIVQLQSVDASLQLQVNNLANAVAQNTAFLDLVNAAVQSNSTAITLIQATNLQQDADITQLQNDLIAKCAEIDALETRVTDLETQSAPGLTREDTLVTDADIDLYVNHLQRIIKTQTTAGCPVKPKM